MPRVDPQGLARRLWGLLRWEELGAWARERSPTVSSPPCIAPDSVIYWWPRPKLVHRLIAKWRVKSGLCPPRVCIPVGEITPLKMVKQSDYKSTDVGASVPRFKSILLLISRMTLGKWLNDSLPQFAHLLECHLLHRAVVRIKWVTMCMFKVLGPVLYNCFGGGVHKSPFPLYNMNFTGLWRLGERMYVKHLTQSRTETNCSISSNDYCS